ncbi:MAG: 3',5'-cyclic-nucleotide phosphodiesterase [Nitrosospira sp.]
MRVTILGCSGGIAEDLRTTCLMVDEDILIDVGTGAGDLTQSEMLRIKSVFLTHSHMDHIALLPMLVNMKAPASLTVYALPETITILKQHIFNFKVWPDYTVLPSAANPYLVFRSVTVGQTIELSGKKITPLPVRHTVPGVGYQLDSGQASFVFSGDTSYHAPFWNAVSAIRNLRYLMIEITYLDQDLNNAEAAGHMHPALLAKGVEHLDKAIHLLITHMEPGNEQAIMSEIETATGTFAPKRLRRGQTFML